MNNAEVARLLEDVAVLLELSGDSPFRSRAYANAARAIETLEEPVADLARREGLDGVPGIGEKIAREIRELLDTGSLARREQLAAAVPEGLLEMREVPGLGAKRLRAIHEGLGISDIDALAKACESGEVARLKGFGKKTAEAILKGIGYLQAHRGRFLADTALEQAEALRAFLAARPEAIRVSVAGSVRRRAETVKDVDLVASSSDAEALGEAFASYAGVREVTGRAPTEVSVVLESGMKADLRIVDDASFPCALRHFTGSREHNTRMQARARDLELRLDEYGLFRGEEALFCADEAALFGALGLALVPPELREGMGEVEQALTGVLPELVAREDLAGTLHVHTSHSDGRATVAQMARKARSLGHSYIAICDHSRAAAYAGGLTEARVMAQWEEIDRVQQEVSGIRILKGIEVDILGDGRLDFADEFLARFDVVVASIHSSFSMTRDAATARLIRAVENPHVDIIGHPTGRLLLSREGYPLDVPAVIDAAARHRTAIEINAHPRRLDLDWRHLRVRASGVRVAVDTDAHGMDELEHVDFGVGIARKAGLRKDDVLNAMQADELLAYLRG